MKTITKIFAAMALALSFVNAEAEDYGFGDMGGVFNVSESGAATYTLPFDLPEGINGMVPSLGLVYNSQSGNGVAGMGVSIYGTSVIMRTTKDIYHDGTAKGISYTDNDAYSLDGVRLIDIAQNDYRPENSPADYFTKTTNGFKAELQNGNIAYFEYKATANGVAYAWYLNKVEDKWGNVMYYSYSTFNGCVYLTRVQYGTNLGASTGLSNIVIFDYETRNDVMPYVVNGTKCSMGRRLTSVTIKTNSVERNKYTLTYSNTDAFSRLTKVEESYGTTKLPPVTLGWKTISSTMSVTTIDDIPSGSYKLYGDINGDGKDDIICIKQNNSSATIKPYYANIISDALSFSNNESINVDCGSISKGQFMLADINGNGNKEVVVATKTTSAQTFSKKTDYLFTINIGNQNSLLDANDFYCNGKSEIICLNQTVSNSTDKYLCRLFSLSTNNATQKNEGYLKLTSAPRVIKTADFNGNGLQDLIVLYSTGYTIYWNNGVNSSTFPFSDSNKTDGSGFNFSEYMDFGDFDGDGLLDIVFLKITSSTTIKYSFTISAATNNGNGSFTKKDMFSCTQGYNANIPTPYDEDDEKISCCAADFNNDGKTDIILKAPSYNKANKQYSFTYRWLKSSGELFTVTKSTELKIPMTLKAGDFNGDGFIELLNYGLNVYSGSFSDTQGNNYLYRCATTSSANKLTSISRGQTGTYTTISYSTLSDASVYTKGSSSTYPLATLCVPMSVVKQVYQNLAYNAYYTNYKYTQLRAHLQGRGLLGFTTVEASNSTTGEKRTTTVNSLHATFYEPSKITTTITKDGKTDVTETTLTAVSYMGKPHLTYPSTVKNTDIYNLVTTTTNEYYSIYYPTKQRTEYGNNANMYKQVEYSDYKRVGGVYKPQTVLTTQKHYDDANAFTTKTTYTYDVKGNPTKMVENAATVPVTHEYTYSGLGNMLTHKVSASGITAVTTTLTYDATNRFVASEKSSANSLITNYTYNNLGRLTQKQEGVSGSLLTTSYTYDAIGNITKITHPDSTITTYTRSWGTMPYRSYSVTTKNTGQAAATTWYDNLGREVETTSTGEKGVSLTSTKSYNTATGQLYSHYNTIGGITISEIRGYNKLGQLTSVSSNSGKKITYSYSARSVTSTQSGINYILQKNFDAWGNITYVSANSCTSTTYKYSSNGQPVSVRYADASYQDYMASTMTYDSRGQQTSLTDVDAGKTSYEYDALGRVTKQTDARGNITTNTYNASGLLTKQVCGGVVTTYTYDNKLRLTKESTGSQSIAYEYDDKNRLTKKSYSIDGTVLTFSYTYNSNGQMATQTFPDGMTETYTYDANGYLATIKIGGQRVWERDSYTGTQRRWALGTQPLYVTRKYSDKGLLTEQEIIRQAGSLHKMTYSFDGATGNLKSRTGMQSGTETFNYDQFDRLNTGTSYALNGNIASKTGIGKYTYDTGKKNAVVQVENTDNLIQGAASLTYNAFNKVATVVQGTNTLTITYGPDHQRTKTVLVNGSNTTTTLYADNYEQRTTNGITKSYHYVASPDGLAAVYMKSGSTATAYYIETDHLGSIVRAYDYIGNIKFSAAYDAWGNQTVSTNAIGLTRGYTGHEHWPQFGLIDMNGRFYDPLIGRFLSPDPYVQAPDNPQNYNRYAYCLNNPLKYTDPSGFTLSPAYTDPSISDSFGDNTETHHFPGGGNNRNSTNDCDWIVYWRSSFTGNWCSADSYGTFTTYAYTPFAFHSGSSGSPNLTNSHPQIGNDYIKAGGYGYSGRSGGRGGSGGGGRTIRQPIRKNVVVQNGGGIITGASYANTVINSAFSSAWKNAPNANLGSNGKIYWEGKFYGNQYVTVKSLSSITRPIARTTGILGIVISGADVGYTYYNEGYFGPETQAATAEAVGGLAGSSLGLWGGAALGGYIGAHFGGIGAIPGAVIGGFFFGTGLGIGGGRLTKNAYEWYNDR